MQQKCTAVELQEELAAHVPVSVSYSACLTFSSAWVELLTPLYFRQDWVSNPSKAVSVPISSQTCNKLGYETCPFWHWLKWEGMFGVCVKVGLKLYVCVTYLLRVDIIQTNVQTNKNKTVPPIGYPQWSFMDTLSPQHTKKNSAFIVWRLILRSATITMQRRERLS